MASYNPVPNVKVILIGVDDVGKTHILEKWKYGSDVPEVTGGIDRTTLRHSGLNLEVRSISATDDQEFRIDPRDVRFAKVVVCVYDITSEESYDEIPSLMRIVESLVDYRAIFFLVGNNADLVHRREVEEADGERFANQHRMTFMECSGLTGQNVNELLESISGQVISVYNEIYTTYMCDESYVIIEPNDIIREDSLTPKKIKRGWKWIF